MFIPYTFGKATSHNRFWKGTGSHRSCHCGRESRELLHLPPQPRVTRDFGQPEGTCTEMMLPSTFPLLHSLSLEASKGSPSPASHHLQAGEGAGYPSQSPGPSKQEQKSSSPTRAYLRCDLLHAGSGCSVSKGDRSVTTGRAAPPALGPGISSKALSGCPTAALSLQHTEVASCPSSPSGTGELQVQSPSLRPFHLSHHRDWEP